jgi:NAD(P)-dependent dehydrogenase (short-subunit alcohol dehydrogenase family)
MSRSRETPFDPLFDVSNKVMLVIGSGGFGQHMARTLCERGATVAVFDQDPEGPSALQGQHPDILTGQVDICEAPSISAMIEATVAAFGRIDGAVNAAGILRTASAIDLPLDAFRQSLEINLTGAFQLSRLLAEAMIAQGGGRILHLASVSSLVSNEEYAAYAASKAGLSQLIRVLAREWAPHNVLINAIGPSMAATEMTRKTFETDAARAKALSVIPMGRFCTPEDITGAALLTLTDAGSYITGQTLFVDGGRTLV